MLVDVTVGHLSSLSYILLSLVFFDGFIIIIYFHHFHHHYWLLCFLFTVAAWYLTCVRYTNFISFSFDYIMLFCTNYSNLVLHSFSDHHLPKFNMCIFNYGICLLWHCWKNVIFSNGQVFTQITVRQLHQWFKIFDTICSNQQTNK